MSKQRHFYIDILRCLAAVAVIFYHVGASGVYSDLTSMLNNWCVPVFVCISGIVFLGNGKEHTYSSITKYVLHLLIPLLLWSFFYNFASLTIMDPPSILRNALKACRMILAADTSFGFQFWYLYMALGIYLTIPLFSRFINHSSKQDSLSLMWIVLFFSIILRTLSMCVFGIYDISFWKSAFVSFTGFAVYLLVGYHLHTSQMKKLPFICLLATALIQLGIGAWLAVTENEFYHNLVGYQSILTCELTVIVIVVAQRLAPRIEKSRFLRAAVKAVADHSFGIFIIHVIVVQFLRKIFGVDAGFAPQYISVPILVAAVLSISLGISYVMKKIPVLKQLV